jgi:organic hydroperoxide reductase OsmC/OhrA
MNISARIFNENGKHQVSLTTGGNEHSLNIPSKPEGFGSRVNGGELLFLALATCYCNDLYREAKKRKMVIDQLQVEVSGEFGGEGEGARNIEYRASVVADAPQDDILDLMRHTDSVAEIHNTLRASTPVMLAHCEARQHKP